MRIKNDPGNEPPNHLYLNSMEEFTKKYQLIRKNRLAIEKAKKDKKEFNEKIPLRFP